MTRANLQKAVTNVFEAYLARPESEFVPRAALKGCGLTKPQIEKVVNDARSAGDIPPIDKASREGAYFAATAAYWSLLEVFADTARGPNDFDRVFIHGAARWKEENGWTRPKRKRLGKPAMKVVKE